jgi:hypothetical protein
LIRIKTLTSYLSASALGIIAGLAGYAFWGLGILPALDLVKPESSIAASVLLAYALGLALTINRFGLRRSGRWILVSAVFATGVGIAGFQILKLDLLLFPLLLSGGLSLLLVQLNRVWSLDRQLTRTLFNSSTANAETEANARLMSGLKLLNTVLPLSEAVVFRCDDSNFLEAVARFKGAAPNAQDPRRNSVWREGIQLCQRAAETGKLVTESIPNQKSGTVAVPLLHEGETAGVLSVLNSRATWSARVFPKARRERKHSVSFRMAAAGESSTRSTF